MAAAPSRHKSVLLSSITALAVIWVGQLDPRAQSPSYRLITMTSGVGPGGPAMDVSDSGIVVGLRSAFGTIGGYQWTEATGLVPIGDAVTQSRFPVRGQPNDPRLGVNSVGTIVGQGLDPAGGTSGAALWSSGTGYVFLGVGQSSQTARAVSASGAVVGLFHGNSSRPFIWRAATGMQYIPGFAIAGGSDAYDINDSDVVVGVAGGGTCGSPDSSAFTWTAAGGLVCLPKVDLTARYSARAVSDNGRVVGTLVSAAGVYGAFSWTQATGTVHLQAPAGTINFMDVNDAGDVVATVVNAGTSTPYLYRNGTWTDINSLLPAGAQVRLQTVTGINAAGWMVGDSAPIMQPTQNGIGWLLTPPLSTTSAVGSTPNPSVFGQSVTVTATVQHVSTPATTGTVTFSEGATTLAGPIAVNASGQASFSTAALPTGMHTITATFSGGPGFLPSSGNVVQTVTAAPPTSQNDAYSTSFETPLTVPAPGILGNDAANGGGVLTASLLATVAHGTLALAANGQFTYTPDAGFVGPDTFTYRASNSVGSGNQATVTIAVANPTTAQPPTGLYVSSMRGNDVTFRWNAPALGPAPEYYILTGGLTPGDVIASVPTGHGYPIFTITVPDGAFYVRMHTYAAGGASGPSNEVRVFVNTATPPTAPADLVGLVNGSSLSLAWRNTYGGAAPTTMLLDVTGSVNTTVPIGLTDAFSFSPVPGGTYTLTVRGMNTGGVGPPSPPVTLTFPAGCAGAPLPPVRFLAYKANQNIVLLWDPAPTGPAPTEYLLQVTGSFIGSLPISGRTVSGSVGPGSYNLSVRAVNACGTSAATPVQTIVVP